jgi:hypothetical protein
MELVDRWLISLAGWWYWSRLAGFRTPLNELSRYAGGRQPDPWQRYAIVSPRAELCCVASAGSGKTTVLTARIALLMSRRDVPPSCIRAVTFMKKAALEMEERVQRLWPGSGTPVISTIHSLCYREILKLSGSVQLASLERWWASANARDLRAECTRGAVLDAYRIAGGAGERAEPRNVLFELGRDLASLDGARVNVEAARLSATRSEQANQFPWRVSSALRFLPANCSSGLS